MGAGAAFLAALVLVMAGPVGAASDTPLGGKEGGDTLTLPLMEIGSGFLACLAWSPDGATFVTGGYDKKAHLWDAGTGRKLRVFEGHTGEVLSVACSPDGSRILTGSADATAKLWDAATGAEIRTLSGHTFAVLSVAFSPDGCRAVTGGGWSDETAKVWDLETGEATLTLAGDGSALTSAVFSPDGTKVVTAPEYGPPTLWDSTTGEALHTYDGSVFRILSIAFSADGARVALGTDFGMVFWNPGAGAEVVPFTGIWMGVNAVAFSPDLSTALTGEMDGSVRLRDTATGTSLRVFLGHAREVRAVAFSPDGRQALSFAGDSFVRLWDVGTGEEERAFIGHMNTVYSAVYSPDGKWILTGDTCPKLWNAETGEAVRAFTNEGWGETYSVAFSPDGSRVLAASGYYTASLWSTETGELLRTFPSEWPVAVTCVAYSPDGTRVITGSEQGLVKLWNPDTGELIKTMYADSRPVSAVAFSPDGRQFATGNFMESTVRLWDVETGTSIRSLYTSGLSTYSVAFSPDGSKIAAALDYGEVRVWEAATGTRLLTLSAHTDEVRSVAFSPDGTKLLTGSQDNTAKLWGASTGALLRTFSGFQEDRFPAVFTVAFSPDGTRVLIGSDDGVARIWPVTGTVSVVPGVVGKTQSGAEAEIAGAGLSVGTVTEECSGTVPAGTVISQQPEPGSRRESGTPVDLCVSTGPCPVTVPEVVGLEPAVAASALLGGQLTIGDVTEACSDTVAAGRVAVQTPAAGTSAAPGAAVHLTVSTGPCPVPVPSVVGLDPVTAQGVILRAGLAVGDIAEVCGSPVAAGHVNSQTPVRGTSVPPGTAVHLTVSTGPCPVGVPMVVGLDRVAAAGAVLAAGLVVGDVMEVCDDMAGAGQVTVQSPAPGTSVAPGTAVQLTVSTGPCPMIVPNVAGLNRAAAADAVLAAGLVVGDVAEVCDDTVIAGQVIAQTPVPGTSIAPGTLVHLTVSAGPCPVNVPAVAGLARPAAEGMLLGAGLTVGNVVEVCDDTAAAGRVTVQTPASGTFATPGTAVHLTVSTGSCPVNVPDVTGWARAEAVRGLVAAGLVAGAVTEQFSNTVPAGTVMGTTPPAGTLVSRGAAVRLEVSKGPLPVESEGEPVRPVSVPEVTGMTRAVAELRLVSSGFTLGSMTEVFHDSAPVGEVLGQDPPAGAPAVWGSPMSLTVSKGPEAAGCQGCQKVTGFTGRRLGDLFLGALALVSLAVMGRRTA